MTLCSFTVSELRRNTLGSGVDFAVDSGHGGRVRDMDGDELDGFDEGNAIQP